MRTRLSILAAAVLALAPGRARANAERSPDHDVKAALLFNFLKFVAWADGTAPLQLCIVGDTPVLGAATALQGRAIGGREVKVRGASPGALGGCNLAFVSASVTARADAVAGELRAARSLVVTDAPGLASRGTAHIGFFVADDHVRFEANIGALRRDGLEVSSKLLRLARIVGDT